MTDTNCKSNKKLMLTIYFKTFLKVILKNNFISSLHLNLLWLYSKYHCKKQHKLY